MVQTHGWYNLHFHSNHSSLDEGEKTQVGCPIMELGSGLGEELLLRPSMQAEGIDTAIPTSTQSLPEEFTSRGSEAGKGSVTLLVLKSLQKAAAPCSRTTAGLMPSVC